MKLLCFFLDHKPDVRLVTSAVGKWEPKRVCARCHQELRWRW